MLHEVPQPGVGLRDKSRDWKTCHGSSTHYMEMLSRGEARIRLHAPTQCAFRCCSALVLLCIGVAIILVLFLPTQDPFRLLPHATVYPRPSLPTPGMATAARSHYVPASVQKTYDGSSRGNGLVQGLDRSNEVIFGWFKLCLLSMWLSLAG
jgi:hypothetical protein